MQSQTSQPELLDFFRGLANEKRQQILFGVLSDKNQHTVGEIARDLGIAQSTTSEHLSQLKRCGLVESEKREREVFYKINKTQIGHYLQFLTNWLDCC